MTSKLHETAVRLAGTYNQCEHSLVDVLIEMAEKNEFIQLKFLDLFDYLVRALKISESQSGYFNRVVQKARVIPELRVAVVSGKVSVSQARRICGVIDRENCEEWIEMAATLSQRQLEKVVAKKQPRTQVHEGFKSIAEDLNELKVALTDEEEELVRHVQDLLSQKLQKPASLQEVLRAMAEGYIAKNDPVKKAERASSRTRSPIKSEPGSHYIKAALKHQVHLRDRFRCTIKDEQGHRCKNTRWLDTHHIIRVCDGGDNSLDNLTTVCFSHHTLIHLGENPIPYAFRHDLHPTG